MTTQLFNLPNERIKLTYDSEHAGEKQTIELPLKLLILGNFQGSEGSESLTERKRVDVDKQNFSSVMNNADVNLITSVTDRLCQEKNNKKGSLPINIRFKSLSDFHPDVLIEQVPELAKLVKFRNLLTKAKTHPKQIEQTIQAIKELLTP